MTDFKSVNTIISLSLNHFNQFSSVEGNLILEGKLGYFINRNLTFNFSLFKGWHPVCDKNEPLPKEFKIAFNVPDTNLTNIEVCASIMGPEKFLPTFLQSSCNVTHTPGKKVCKYIM